MANQHGRCESSSERVIKIFEHGARQPMERSKIIIIIIIIIDTDRWTGSTLV